MNNLVNYVAEGGVATLTLNDPPVNAFTHEMMKELDEAVLEARFDGDVHAIVITGKGERYFSSGANANMLREVDPSFKYYFYLHANETLLRLENTPKLVVAAINGHCIGGGLELALACDIRVARRGAGRLGLPEIELGVMPATGGTMRMARLLGKARAMQLLLEGGSMDFDRALELGLVTSVIDATTGASFLEEAIAYARRLGPPRRSPLAVGRLKRAAHAAVEQPLEQGLALERELAHQLFQSEDAEEGFAAFAEQRPPAFKGK